VLTIDNIIPKRNQSYVIYFRDKEIQKSKTSIYDVDGLSLFQIIDRYTIKAVYKGGLIKLFYKLQKLSYKHSNLNIDIQSI